MLGQDGLREISEGQILISWHEVYLTKGKIRICNEKDDDTLRLTDFQSGNH